MTKHDCVKRINTMLADHNTQIELAISFESPQRELIMVTTCKVDTGKRGKPVTMFASYCPFCGTKLNKEEPK